MRLNLYMSTFLYAMFYIYCFILILSRNCLQLDDLCIAQFTEQPTRMQIPNNLIATDRTGNCCRRGSCVRMCARAELKGIYNT